MRSRHQREEIERQKTITQSALDRLADALRDYKRAAVGDEAYFQELLAERIADVRARADPPPEAGVRKRLIPIAIWIGRMRGRSR